MAAASETDVFCKVGEPGTATTMTAPGHTIGGTSISVVSTANYPTDTGVIFAIDTVSIVDGKEVRDVGSYTEWEGTVGGATTLENMVLRYGDDQNYPAGATTRVYIPVSSSRENRLVDGLLVAHDQNGKLLGTADSFVGTAGEIGGAWKAYTPTVTGAASTSAIIGRYSQVGKTVDCYVAVWGVSNATTKYFSYPVPPAAWQNGLRIAPCLTEVDAGVTHIAAAVHRTSTLAVQVYRGFNQAVATSPLTGWADSGNFVFYLNFTYEAA